MTNDNQLIAFCGGMGAGKDTYGNLYAQYIKENYKKTIVHYSFASPLKEELNFIIDSIRYNKHTDTDLAKLLNVTIRDILVIKTLIKQEDIINFGFNSSDRSVNIRKILQFWGTGVRRRQNELYWVNKVKDFLIEQFEKGNLVYITDARFLNEIEMLKEINGKLILLQAGQKERIRRIQKRDNLTPSPEVLIHPSETEFTKFADYDYEIDTNKIKPENFNDWLKDNLF